MFIEDEIEQPDHTENRRGKYGVKRHFLQYFSYIVAISFIGGENRSTRRNPQTLTNFIT